MGYNWPMMSGYRQMNYMNGHEGHRYQSFHKREAEAEPEADAYYGYYGYARPYAYGYRSYGYPAYGAYGRVWG